MKQTQSHEQDDYSKSVDRTQNAYLGGYQPDRQNDQNLLYHAKEKLKGRLYESGLNQQSLPPSLQKPIFQPSTIVPRRVIQGYKFYQTRLDETHTMNRQKGGNPSNLNNLTNLVDQSFNQTVSKAIRLPKIPGNKITAEARSRSMYKNKDFRITPKQLEDSPEGDRFSNNLNQSFGVLSPIGKDQSMFISKRPDEFDISGKKMDLNLTYDETISKRIIGKLTGKNLLEPKSYNPRIRSNSVRSRGLSFVTEDDNTTIGGNMLQGNEGPSGKINQLQDIDSFIYLIKEGKINPSEFIYLVRKDGDHYNLKVTDYSNIKDKIYWTLSAKGVTKYDSNFPVEFIHLKDWLRERDQYNHIKRLQFFKQFRSWKTLKKWVKILRRNDRNSVKAQLNEKLFIANPYFQRIIRQHKESCLEIENLRIVEIGGQYQNLEVQNLEEFKSNQEKKRAEVVEKLQGYSEKLHDNARAGIKKILEKLRDHIIDEMANDEDKGQDELRDIQEAKNQLNSKNVFETLGFPEFMNYGHRSMLRRECTRFLRMAYLLDFMTVEAMGNMYVSSAQDMVAKINELSNVYEEGPRIVKYGKKQYTEPIFNIHIGLQISEIDTRDISNVDIGTDIKNIEDFDLMSYAQFEKEVIKEDDEKNSPVQKKKKQPVQEKVAEAEEEKILTKRSARNLSDKWLNLTPNKQIFKREFESFFESAVESIQVIERWSKHSEFQPYADALEEWDEMIGEKWVMPENKYLGILWYLKENNTYKTFKDQINEMFDLSFSRADSLLRELNYYLDFYWRDIHTDFQVLGNDRLKSQNYIYMTLYKLYKQLTQKFEENIITHADIGLFRMDLAELRSLIVPQAGKTVEYLETYLPQVMRQRTIKMRTWLQESIRKLSGIVAGIEEFIEQKNNFNKISYEYEVKRSLIDSLYEFFQILQDNSFPLANDDKEQFNKLGILISDLSSALQSVEMATNKNTDRFTKTLTERIGRLVQDAHILREEIVQGHFLDPTDNMQAILSELTKIDKTVQEYEKITESYKFYEEVLQVQEYGNFNKIEELRNDLSLRILLWKCKSEWETLAKEWMGLPFTSIDAKQLGQQADIYAKNVYKCEKNLPESVVIKDIKKKVYDFRDTMPVVTALRSQYLKPSHWEEIKKVLKSDFNTEDENFTLSSLMALRVADYQEELLNIATQATQEFALEGQIAMVEAFWKEMGLTIESYKGLRETYIIKDVDLILTALDEYLSTMSNILASRYVKNLRAKAEKIQGELLLLQDVLDKWMECQKKWMYLENIFSAPDIKKQLAEENNMFVQCDKSLKTLFKRAIQNPNTMRVIKIPNILDNLTKTSDNYFSLKRSDISSDKISQLIQLIKISFITIFQCTRITIGHFIYSFFSLSTPLNM